jgi:hypothetical protein
MLNFYHRFLPAIAHILKPLTDATAGKGKLLWTSEMQFSFDQAKALPFPSNTLAPLPPYLMPQMLLILMLARFYNNTLMPAGYCRLSFPTNFLQQKAAILILIVNFLLPFKPSNISISF